MKKKRVVLVGNPNVGKSCLFSRLTGADAIISNYPGTTVEFYKGSLRIRGETFELIDAPGAYSLESPCNKAEEIAKELAKSADIIILVLDATNLERSLYIALETLKLGKPTIVALNLWDEAKRKGINIDIGKLEDILQVPVIPTVAISGEGINTLVSRIKDANVAGIDYEHIWEKIGEIIREVQRVEHRHATLKEKIEKLTVQPCIALPLAAFILFLCFYIVVNLGNFIIERLLDPLFSHYYLPLLKKINNHIGSEFLRKLLIGQLIDGEIDFMQSFGLLSTGIYVPVVAVLPFVFLFYLVLGILEDIGYLPRLAVTLDNIFHKFGLHGCAIISTLLGLGCNVPGALSTRILETRKQRFIAACLISIAVPCTAQSAIIFGLLGRQGIKYVACVYATLFAVYVILGLILNRLIKGEVPEILMEIPPYRWINPRILAKKTWLRLKQFFVEALPFVFLGVLIANLLYFTGIVEIIGNIAKPVVHDIFGLKKEAAAALIVGFLRKDVAVGMLAPLNMTANQLAVACVILAVYFPCVATFATLLRELGIKDFAKVCMIMILTAFVAGVFLRILLTIPNFEI